MARNRIDDKTLNAALHKAMTGFLMSKLAELAPDMNAGELLAICETFADVIANSKRRKWGARPGAGRKPRSKRPRRKSRR